VQLQWDSIAPGANWQSKHEVVKNFMSQYSGAAIFFLIDKIPTGVALAKVRLFSSGTFHTLYSINIFQFLQDDVLGDAEVFTLPHLSYRTPLGVRVDYWDSLGLHWDSTGTGPSANYCQIVGPSPSPIQVESEWNPSPTWNS
jgi:hypothetical protein